MIISFDPSKRLANIAKHSLDFNLVEEDFFHSAMIITAKLGRYKAIGKIGGVLAVVLIFAPLGDEAVSIVSMRRANLKERILIDG